MTNFGDLQIQVHADGILARLDGASAEVAEQNRLAEIGAESSVIIDVASYIKDTLNTRQEPKTCLIEQENVMDTGPRLLGRVATTRSPFMQGWLLGFDLSYRIKGLASVANLNMLGDDGSIVYDGLFPGVVWQKLSGDIILPDRPPLTYHTRLMRGVDPRNRMQVFGRGDNPNSLAKLNGTGRERIMVGLARLATAYQIDLSAFEV